MSALCSRSKIGKWSDGVSHQATGLLWGLGLERGTRGFRGLVTRYARTVDSPQASCRWCADLQCVAYSPRKSFHGLKSRCDKNTLEGSGWNIIMKCEKRRKSSLSKLVSYNVKCNFV